MSRKTGHSSRGDSCHCMPLERKTWRVCACGVWCAVCGLSMAHINPCQLSAAKENTGNSQPAGSPVHHCQWHRTINSRGAGQCPLVSVTASHKAICTRVLSLSLPLLLCCITAQGKSEQRRCCNLNMRGLPSSPAYF